MKLKSILLPAGWILVSGLCAATAQGKLDTKPLPPEPRPPVSRAPNTAILESVYIYEQKPLQSRPALIPAESARRVVEQFREVYTRMGSPRVVLYVNRELVDEQSGLALTERNKQRRVNRRRFESTFDADKTAPKEAFAPESSGVQGGNVQITGNVGSQPRTRLLPGSGNSSEEVEHVTQEDRFTSRPRPELTLSDRQTVRDVERLFGRPLRMGGARLADQRVAAQTLDRGADGRLEPTSSAGNEAARWDREALRKVADVVVEVLISSRSLTVREVSGERTYTVPDIQATAIRLSDSQILGQASATDIIGFDRYAGPIVRQFEVREIAEATALALMEDFLLSSDGI